MDGQQVTSKPSSGGTLSVMIAISRKDMAGANTHLTGSPIASSRQDILYHRLPRQPCLHDSNIRPRHCTIQKLLFIGLRQLLVYHCTIHRLLCSQPKWWCFIILPCQCWYRGWFIQHQTVTHRVNEGRLRQQAGRGRKAPREYFRIFSAAKLHCDEWQFHGCSLRQCLYQSCNAVCATEMFQY